MSLMEMENKSNMYVVIFSEKEKLELPENVVELFKLQSQVIENFIENNDMYLPGSITSDVFRLILKYIDICPANFEYDFPKPITRIVFNEKAGMFEAWLNSLRNRELIKLLNAANYLIMPGLTSLLCAYLALKFRGMTREQLQDFFSQE
jgi:hypothetical protein